MNVAPRMYIGGEWCEAEGGRRFAVFSPATGEQVGEAPDGGAAETLRAIEAARAAFPAWAALPPVQRAVPLLKLHALLLEHAEELARTIVAEQGKPLAQARGEVNYAAGFLAWYAEEGKRVYGETVPASVPNKRYFVLKQPVGVVAAITPWNFPLGMLTRKLGPALAAGCTVVAKPAEQTPLTAIRLFELVAKAGFPPGVVNLVTGSDPAAIGDALLDHPAVRKVTFTGSTAVGKHIMARSAATLKRLSLELGGHAPYLVFADADVDLAVDALVQNKYRNAGQTCVCANRVYVERPVLERFTRRLVERVRALRVGDPFASGIDVGPLIDRAGLAKVEEQVADAVRAGATVLTGGRRLAEGALADGWFYAPTVLADVTPEMRVCREETFGPVAPLIAFDSEAEALRMANDTPYGLVAYVFTRDIGRAVRVTEGLEYGIVGLNDPHAGGVPQSALGGWKESGLGREGGRQGLEEFLETKFASLALQA